MKKSGWIHGFLKEERGTGMVEYSLLLAFVMFALVGLAGGYGSSLVGVTRAANADLSSASAFAQGTSHVGAPPQAATSRRVEQGSRETAGFLRRTAPVALGRIQ